MNRDLTLLITGTHGLVGQYLYKLRHQWAGKIVFTGRGPCRLPTGDHMYEEMDITREEDIQNVFAKHHPDVVIHAAAMAQADECELEPEKAILHNVKATELLLNASQQFNSFFIFLSTDFVFSGDDGPYAETSMPDPVNFYGQTKWMAEKLVEQHAPGYAIVRTVLIYGNVLTGTRSNMISWAKATLEKGAPCKVVSDQVRATTYAADLASALFTIADKKANGIWNIAGKDNLSPYEIFQQVASHLGLDGSIAEKVDAATFTQPARRPLKTTFNIEKAKKELGYAPHSFMEGMQKVLQGD